MIEKKLAPVTAAFASAARPCRRSSRPRVCRDTIGKRATFMAIDDNAMSTLDPAFVDATSLATSPSGITPARDFEPVLNTEAAASFAIIAVVFTLLQLRINAVSGAAKRRSSALEALREAESLQLSTAADAGDDALSERVTSAKIEYESALKEELDLRTIIPGVRIVAPNDPKRDEEERAAAKRFLGWGSDEFGDDPEYDNESNNLGLGLDGGGNGVQSNESNAGLSTSAKLILGGVASMLIVLLWTLSFDPMVADQVFTAVGGNPPSDMPLSSW